MTGGTAAPTAWRGDPRTPGPGPEGSCSPSPSSPL